jgi:uncharacterized protein (DUF2236 family)
MDDYGLFGPDSVAWRVWGYPTSLTIGFQRAVVIEELDPFLLASVQATNKVRTQSRTRYDHTIRYFATVAFADSHKVVQASQMLMKLHARNVGIEPVSGHRFDANDPDSQLWILLTGWHSVLYAYEKYGPGPLSDEDDRRYWADCAIAAQMQTCDPAKVPRTRAGVRAYFEEVRPRLAASETTQAMMAHLLNPEAIFPPQPAVLRPVAWVVSRTIRAATIATMPRWQRRLANVRQSRVVDAAVSGPMRIAFKVADRTPRVKLQMLKNITPGTVPIVEPIWRGVPARHERTVSPAEAFRTHGVPTPAELRRPA